MNNKPPIINQPRKEPEFDNLMNNTLFVCAIDKEAHNVLEGKIYIINMVSQVASMPQGLQFKTSPVFMCEKCYLLKKQQLEIKEPSPIISPPSNVPSDILKN